MRRHRGEETKQDQGQDEVHDSSIHHGQIHRPVSLPLCLVENNQLGYAAILCKGLEGTTPKAVMELESDFVPKIVGAQLVRVRSQTTYYILSRMKGICKVWSDRQRASIGES